jgi:hypothetical protein
MNGFKLGDLIDCRWESSGFKGHFLGKLERIVPDKNDEHFFFTLNDKHGVQFFYLTSMCTKFKKVKRAT